MFPFNASVIIMLILLGFIPSIQESFHWIKYVDVRVGVSNLDVNDGVSM